MDTSKQDFGIVPSTEDAPVGQKGWDRGGDTKLGGTVT